MQKMKFFIFFSILISKSQQFSDTFDEELFLKPLPSGHINSFFQFTTNWQTSDNDSLHHTNLVARPIAEILLQYNIKELHISLTSGLWRYENWGYPPIDAPPGAEVWAWFSGNLTDVQVDRQWEALCGILSGLLCASLNFIDHTNTLRPEFSFRPQFTDGETSLNSKFIRYSTLPREIVCTENLTPWKKLLPCSNTNGLASLLNAGQIYNTNYHSLGLHIRSLCSAKACANTLLEIKQTVNLVFDNQLISSNRDWSIRKMFGQGLGSNCYLAESSKIYLDTTDSDFELTPEPNRIFTSQRGGSVSRIAEFDIKTWTPNRMYNIAAIYREKTNLIQLISPPPLYAKRFTLGVGQERGKVVTKIINTHWSPLNVIFQENIPWFVAIYLHTLTIKHGNELLKPIALKYIPGIRRERPYHLEVAFKIPARSTVDISFNFDFIFLKWLEYPPDANHGHYLGSAVISAQLPVARNYTAVPIDGCLFVDGFNATRSNYLIQIRTGALLISMPTPDFSMPYNVICLTCTVVALAFGPIHNITTKRIVFAGKNGSKKFKAKILSFFGKKTVNDDDDDVKEDECKTDAAVN